MLRYLYLTLGADSAFRYCERSPWCCNDMFMLKNYRGVEVNGLMSHLSYTYLSEIY